jgi:spore germination protein GerM
VTRATGLGGRRHPGRLVVAVLAVAVLATACGIPVASSPTKIPKSAVPFNLLSPKTSTTVPANPPVGAREQIYLVSTPHVVAVIRDVAPPATLTDVLIALLDGPTAAESAAGLQSFLTGPTSVKVSLDTGIATVNFGTNPFQIVGPDQTLAVAQVVYTATSQPGVTGVLFQIDGKPIEVPTAAGVQVPGPVTDATYAPQAPVAAGA